MTLSHTMNDGLRRRLQSTVPTKPYFAYTAGLRQNSKYVPYIDRVRFARRKKPNTWTVVMIEILAIILVIVVGTLSFVYRDDLHMNVMRMFAHLGSVKAQNLLSQHLLNDIQNQAEVDEAIYWLRKAAKNGDPIANYNLVVAHLKEHAETEDLSMDEVRQMMEHADNHGIVQARHFLDSCKGESKCSSLAKKLDKTVK